MGLFHMELVGALSSKEPLSLCVGEFSPLMLRDIND